MFSAHTAMADNYTDLSAEVESYYATYSEYLNEASFQRAFGYGVLQWREEQRDLLRRLKMPALQKNEMAKHIKSAVAEFAANTPALEVKCYNPDVDAQIIKQYQHIIDSIDKKSSDAKIQAYEAMLRTGMCSGLFIEHDYDDDTSFDQSIHLNFIDYESLYFDPSSQTPTKEDGRFIGYLRRVSKDYFKKRWPGAEPASMEQMTYTGNASDSWVYSGREDEVIIAHHFKKIFGKRKTIYQTTLGRVIEKDEPLLPQEEILREREIEDIHVECYILSGIEILEKPKRYPVPHLPIIGCQGYQALIKGRIYPYSYGNEVHDMQRLQNFAMSQIGGSVLQMRSSTTVWDKKTLNSETYTAIKNKTAPTDLMIDMQPGKIPIRWDPQELSQSLLALYGEASAQIDSTLGRYENAQGTSSGASAMSGIAKSMEINQANLPIYFYLHPMITALNRVGVVLQDLIPKIYVNQRNITFRSTQIKMNSGDPQDLNFDENFEPKDYDIYIKAGASFTIQRDTYRKSMEMIYKNAPQELQLLLAPMMFELMDVPNLPRLEDIYKKFIALTQPELYSLLQDVPAAQIEQEVAQAMQKKQQMQQSQEMMQAQAQQGMLQKQQQEMQIEEQKISLDTQKLALDTETLALKKRAQEAEELQNTTNFHLRTEEIDQRERDTTTKLEIQEMKNQAEVTKAAISRTP